MAQRIITITDIRCKSAPSQKKWMIDKNNYWATWVIKKISYHPTWLFLKLGLSANQITVMSLIVGVIGCGLLAFGNYIGAIVGALLTNIWILLDCIDGMVARYNGTASDYGSFLETVVWAVFSALFFISVGLSAFNHPDPVLNSVTHRLFGLDINRSLFIFLGGWASVFYISHEFIYSAYARTFSDSSAIVAQFKQATTGSLLHKIELNLDNISGILMPTLLFAVVFRFLSLFILLWALIPTLAFIAVVVKTLSSARRVQSQV